MEHLVWTRAGAVWAADYTQPDSVIDGRFRYVLCVRDLATGMQFLSEPVEDADSPTAAAQLGRLLAIHSPPLVLKTDNASHFKGELTAVLDRHDVVQLLSPPGSPRYPLISWHHRGQHRSPRRPPASPGAHGWPSRLPHRP
jgi:hypothetical protein